MGEPIVLYDHNGESVTVYGKAQAALLVEAGKSTTPPAAPKPKPTAEATDGQSAGSRPADDTLAPRKVTKRAKR